MRQQRQQLAVGLGAEPGHHRGVVGGAEQVQRRWATPTRSGAARWRCGSARCWPAGRPACSGQRSPLGRQRGERAEVGVGVDATTRSRSRSGDQVADHKRAGGLAHAALGADHRGHVGAAERGLLGQQPLELRLFALCLGDQQPRGAALPARRGAVCAGLPSTTALRMQVAPAQLGRGAHRSRSTVPTCSMFGSPVPIRCSLRLPEPATSRASCPFEASEPSSRRAIDHRLSPCCTV